MITKDKKLVYTKKDKNVNLVKLSSEYDTNCSEQEYVAVDDKTLAFMLESDRFFASMERKARNYTISITYNDEIGCTQQITKNHVEEEIGIAEEYQLELERVMTILNTLTDCQRKRIYMLFKLEMTYKEIGRIEGVGISSIQSSCELALAKLKPHGQYLQRLNGIKWVDLLI